MSLLVNLVSSDVSYLLSTGTLLTNIGQRLPTYSLSLRNIYYLVRFMESFSKVSKKKSRSSFFLPGVLVKYEGKEYAFIRKSSGITVSFNEAV